MAPRSSPTILLLAYIYPPENLVGALRMHRFARYLPEHGYRVRVLASGEFPGAAPEPPALRTPRYNLVWEQAIRKFLMPGEEGFSWSPSVCREVGKLGENYTAIISTAPPIGGHLTAYRLQRKLGIPWLADLRDPLVGSPVRRDGWMPQIDPWLEKRIVARAAAVTVVTDVMQQDLRARYPDYAERVHLLWNGFDPQDIHSPPLQAEGQRRILLHLGSLYGYRNPNALLAAAARLIQQDRVDPASFQIRLVGYLEPEYRQAQPEIWRMLEEKGSLVTIEHLPPEAARQEMERAGSLLLIDVGEPNVASYALPVKIFEYVHSRRPILAMTVQGSPVEWALKQCGVPTAFLYAGNTPLQAEQAILDWLATPPRLYEPSPWFWETFDGRKQVGQLAEILDGLTGRSKAFYAGQQEVGL